VLDDASYERFRIMRYSVPPCFDLETFDLIVQLGQRLSIRLSLAPFGGAHFWVSNALHYVDALAGVYTLDLSHQWEITDVSTLGGVHKLILRGCRGIRDVSALGGVHTLDLSHCGGITDVSSLGGVHTRWTFSTAAISRV
jgi:hypothetical protein